MFANMDQRTESIFTTLRGSGVTHVDTDLWIWDLKSRGYGAV